MNHLAQQASKRDSYKFVHFFQSLPSNNNVFKKNCQLTVMSNFRLRDGDGELIYPRMTAGQAAQIASGPSVLLVRLDIGGRLLLLQSSSSSSSSDGTSGNLESSFASFRELSDQSSHLDATLPTLEVAESSYCSTWVLSSAAHTQSHRARSSDSISTWVCSDNDDTFDPVLHSTPRRSSDDSIETVELEVYCPQGKFTVLFVIVSLCPKVCVTLFL